MKKNKYLSLFLATLISLGFNASQKSKAETKPLNISSIVNMTEEEAKKTVNINDLIIVSFYIYGRTITIPVVGKDVKIVEDDSQNNEQNTEVIKKIDLLSKFYNSNMNFDLNIGDEITLLLEPASEEIFGIAKIAYGLFSPNELFLKDINLKRYEKEGCEISSFYINYYQKSTLLKKANSNGEVTLENLKEDYQKSYLNLTWPIEEVLEKNQNLILPEFKDTFLNSTKIDNPNLTFEMMYFIPDKKNIYGKILLTYYNSEDQTIYDLLTNEKIINESDKKTNQKYLESIGITTFKRKHMWVDVEKTKTIGLFTFGLSDETIQKTVSFHLNFYGWETIRDLIDAYSYIPEGFEPDYSNYDFTNNPNIVQPDKSSTIISPEGNFIADLDNMSLMPITNKPKIKELTRNS